jgi:hypothetical protein
VKTQSLIAVRHEEEENHEGEEVKEKDPATRETSARRPGKAGKVKAQTAAGRIGKGVESCEKIGRSSYCGSRKEVVGADRAQETQAETEPLTGTSCSTCCRDESQVGCEKGR